MKNKKTEIINIIEIKNGIVASVESTIINSTNGRLRTYAIKEAEGIFTIKAQEHGLLPTGIKAALDNCEFDNNCGYNILLRRSDHTKTV